MWEHVGIAALYVGRELAAPPCAAGSPGCRRLVWVQSPRSRRVPVTREGDSSGFSHGQTGRSVLPGTLCPGPSHLLAGLLAASSLAVGPRAADPAGARAAQVWGSECMNSAGMRADPGYGKSRGITRFFVTFLCDNGALKTLKVKTQFAWKGRQGQRPHTAGLIGTLRRTKTHVWTCPGGCVTVTDLPGVTPATCWVSANLRSGHHPAVCLPLKVPRVSWNTPGVSCRNRPRVPARGRPCPELPWGITSLHVPVFLWL